MLVDTHCHLNHADFADDLDEVLARAQSAGVQTMIVIGFDLPSSSRAIELAGSYPNLYAAVAVHPHDAKEYDSDAEAQLRDLAQNPRVVAIGEIGLDYHYDFSPVESQFAAFRAQLELARDSGLPVIIHCREAYQDVLSVLDEEMDRKESGVMHCWGGSQDEALRALDLGMYLGFGGVITFKNADPLREIARDAPFDRILVETDAPYLAPVPNRGKRNEPAYVSMVAEKLAEVRGISLDSMAEITTRNAARLFPGITATGTH